MNKGAKEYNSESFESALNEVRKNIFDAWRGKLSNKTPETIYHYTDIESLINIVHAKSIYASDVRFLNDANEIYHGKDVLFHEIENFERKKHNTEQRKEIADVLRRNFDLISNLHILSTCFCSEGDLLNQWRDYGASEGRISIGLNRTALEDAFGYNEPGLLLSEVMYKYKNKRDLLMNTLNQYLKVYKDWYNDMEDPDLFRRFRVDLLKTIIQVISTIKDPSFRNENEWRIVIPRLKKQNDIFFQNKVGIIVPRIKLSVGGDYSNLPIDRVIVGPSKQQETTIKSVKNFLYHYGYDYDIAVESEIPYRD